MKISKLALLCSISFSLNIYSMGSPNRIDPESIAANLNRIVPLTEERCTENYAFIPPAEISNSNQGRLNNQLRIAARLADPIYSLKQSILAFAQNKKVLGDAFADLAVTGKKSFAKFQQLHLRNQLTAEILSESLAANNFTEEKLLLSANKALDRAFEVIKNILIHNPAKRAQLGYIAISAEDDQPFRPINVPATDYPQHNITVTVNNIKVDSRYLLVETNKDYSAQMQIPAGRVIPEIASPTISPDAKILVYVHGMGSRMEEALDMFHALKKLGKKSRQNWTMLSIDLPSNGYADQIDHTRVSSVLELGTARMFPPGFDARGRHRVPVLDFIESFVIKAIEKIDQTTPIKNNIEAIIGGSLGGNITFRLGRRTDLPWMKNIITWSPAAIWTSLADGSDMLKQVGVMTAWQRAGGDQENLIEKNSDRAQFFNLVFGGAINIGFMNIVPAQPDQWWRTTWACFENSRTISTIERQEVYSRNYRLWHWRLGAEQLIYSQQGVLGDNQPLFLQNTTRMLLACGEADNFNYTGICGTTQNVAAQMVTTPGKAIFFANTGHSIHNERPMLFSKEIEKFLGN